jgi:hypothetical protein
MFSIQTAWMRRPEKPKVATGDEIECDASDVEAALRVPGGLRGPTTHSQTVIDSALLFQAMSARFRTGREQSVGVIVTLQTLIP